jgi:hypothetical protein
VKGQFSLRPFHLNVASGGTRARAVNSHGVQHPRMRSGAFSTARRINCSECSQLAENYVLITTGNEVGNFGVVVLALPPLSILGPTPHLAAPEHFLQVAAQEPFCASPQDSNEDIADCVDHYLNENLNHRHANNGGRRPQNIKDPRCLVRFDGTCLPFTCRSFSTSRLARKLACLSFPPLNAQTVPDG